VADAQGNEEDQDFDVLSEEYIAGGVRAASKKKHKGLDKVLLRDFSELPKRMDYGDYGVINVSPSVVPVYFPSFRVFNYNISAEAEQEHLERKERRRGEDTLLRPPPHGHRKPDPNKSRDKQCRKSKYKNSWRCHFSKEGWHSDPEAPSRKNSMMTPLGFAQVRSETLRFFL
jgi:endopolyphosphatase